MKKRNLGGKRLSALVLTAAMIVNLAGLSSLYVQATGIDRSETSAAGAAGEEEPADSLIFTGTGRKVTSVESGTSFSGRESGVVERKDGDYVRWIDRIDVPDAVMDFYEGLEEGADNDGRDDFLIDDALFAELTAERPAIAIDFTVGEGESLQERSEDLFNTYIQYLSAAYSAFDRDHPEVFWLGDTWEYSSKVTLQGGDTYRLAIYFVPERSDNYAKGSDIRAGVTARDRNVNAILSAAAGKTDYEKIRYFNQVLTERNQYNTAAAGFDKEAGEAEDGTEAELILDPDCWECVSALAGQKGEKGPVCEGYARAFQVLCQASGIPCILVDGTAVNDLGSGLHMWNYVNLDGAWYGVDVTWNDPADDSDSAKSGKEREDWLLAGGSTVIENRSFLESHPVTNQLTEGGIVFSNGPKLNESKYVEKKTVNVSVQGVYKDETSQSTFTYGDTITVKATASWSEGDSGTSALADLAEPGVHQMALYYGYTQISEPVNAVDGVYTMTYSTLNRQVPVGSQNLTVRFIGDEELSWASRNTAVTLKPLTPVLTVPEDQVFTYDENVPVVIPDFGAELPGVSQELVRAYSYCEKGKTTYTDQLPALPGEYWVKASVAADPDGFWTAAEKTFSLTIKKLVVSIAFKADYTPDKVYDGAAPALPTADQMEITLASYDDVVFTWYRGSVAEANKVTEPTQVGNYILVATLADTNTTERAQTERKVSITRRPVNVRLSDQEKTYGAEDPELTYTVDPATPLVEGEKLNGQPIRKAGESVGSYAVTSGTLTDENNPNYELSFEIGNFTVNPAGYKTEAETVQTILVGNGEFKEPVFTGVRGEKVPGTITYQYEEAEYTRYADLIRVLQAKEIGTVGSIRAYFVPDVGGNYIGNTEVRIAFTVSNITFFVGGYQASEANAVTKKEAPVYGDTWDQIIQLSDQLSARVGGVTDSDPSHFTLNVTGYPAVGSEIPYEVRYNGILDGNVYADMVVCSGTIDVAPALLTWDTTNLTAQDRQNRITDGRATLTGSLQVAGILEKDKETVRFSCPADRLRGTYADVAPGNQKVILAWTEEAAVLQGEGAGNYRLPERLPEITGKIIKVRLEPVSGLAEDRYQLEVEEGLSEVPEALRGNLNLDTTEKIETRMRANIREKTPRIPDGNMAAYDVRLMVSADGQNWVEATAENFPSEGILLTLPYPSGTGKDTHDFTVAHMFTAVRNNYQPGDVEYPAVEKTDGGIRFRVYSLSPIEVGWLPVSAALGTTSAPQPTSSQTATTAPGTSSQTGTNGTQNSTQVAGSQTGDHSSVVYLYLLFLLAAGMVICLLAVRRRVRNR